MTGASVPRACGRQVRHATRSRLLGPVLMAAVVLAALWVPLECGVRVADAIPLSIRDMVFESSVTVGNAIDSVTLERVTITNGAALRMDVSAMLPGPISIKMTDCVCNGGSQIYILGYSGDAVPPSTRRLTVSVSGMQATACSLVVAYTLPSATNVTITNSSLATTTTIGYTTVMGSAMADAVAAPLALYAVSLSGGGSVRVVNTTLATTASGGMAVYVGGSTSLSGSALILDSVQLSASLGPSSYAVYAPTLSLSSGSVLSLTSSTVSSAAYGVYLGTGLSVSASVVRVIECVGALPSPVVQAGGSVTNGGWVLLSWIRAAQLSATIADLSGLTLDGGDVSMVRCLTAGVTLATRPSLTSGSMYVQCNRAAGTTLTTTGAYNNAGLSGAIVKQCDVCSQETSCYETLTSSVATDSGCTCVCSAGGVGAQCLPMDAPAADTSSSSGGAYCLRDTTVTSSQTFGSGLASLCFERVVFSGALTVVVDLSSMFGFAEILNVSVTDCIMEGGAMLRIQGTPDVSLVSPANVKIVNMTATDGTIAFMDGLPRNSSVRIENSTLYSTSANSQYVPTTSGSTAYKYGPVLAFSSMVLDNTDFTVTRSSIQCESSSAYDCSPLLLEYGLTVRSSSSFYLDNSVMRCPRECMIHLSSGWVVDGGSVVSIQNSSLTVVSVSTVRTISLTSLSVRGGSAMLFNDDKLTTPYALMYATDGAQLQDGSWLSVTGSTVASYYGLYFASFTLTNKSVFSVFNNVFVAGTYSSSTAGILSTAAGSSGGTKDSTSFIYGGCNTLFSNDLASSAYSDIGLGAVSQVYDCGTCTQTASCFGAQTSSINGCTCGCSSGGHGNLCLPAPVPTGLFAIPEGDPLDGTVQCITGGRYSSIDLVTNSAGVCFIDAAFSVAVTVDLSLLTKNVKHYNVTMLRCSFSNQFIVMGTTVAPVYVNVTRMSMSAGYLALSGNFAENTEIYVVDSALSATSSYAIYFRGGLFLGANSKLLLLRVTSSPVTYGIYTGSIMTLTNTSFIIDSSSFSYTGTAITNTIMRLYYFNLYQGSTLAITNCDITAGSGQYMSQTVIVSDSLIIYANNRMTGTRATTSQMTYFAKDVELVGTGQVRITNNTISGSAITSIPAGNGFIFRAGTPQLIFSENTVTGSTRGIALTASQFTTTQRNEHIYVRCNTVAGSEVSYSAFPNTTTTLACNTCNENVQCYAPGTASFASSSCTCTCTNSSFSGTHCYPYEVPSIPVAIIPEVPVDTTTTCTYGGTITDSGNVNLWKTHHCYVGVTFSGTDANLIFTLTSMPLTYPINITLVNCTFTSAAVGISGTSNADSVGVSITISKSILYDGCFAIMSSLPKKTTISITEVSGVQTTSFTLPGLTARSVFTSVYMYGIVLSNSAILISNVNTTMVGTASGYMFFISSGTPKLDDHSSLMIRYNTVSTYPRMMYISPQFTISGGSYISFDNNTIDTATDFLYILNDLILDGGSVFRFYGNTATSSVSAMFKSNGNMYVTGGSWLDISGNTFASSTLVYYMGSTYTYSIDATSFASMTRNIGSAIVRSSSYPVFTTMAPGYTFVAGCMTMGSVTIETSTGLATYDMTQQTRVAQCNTCAADTTCFQPLTASVSSSCACNCKTGGYGDACMPAPVLPGPSAPPPPPTPAPPPALPSVGNCDQNMNYPETTQIAGGGVSWLCYRNVTFSGSGMTFTVNVAQLSGGVVNITFDSCTWKDSALLDFNGGINAAITALNIVIVNSQHTNAGLAFRNTFPANTNISVSGSTFYSSTSFPQGGSASTAEYSISSYPGLLLINSAFIVSGCKFTGTTSSYGYFVSTSGLVLRSKSTFGFLDNDVQREGSYLVFFSGSTSTKSITSTGNSTFAIQSNRATTVKLLYLIYLTWGISLSDASVISVTHNYVLADRLLVLFDVATLANGSYLKVSDNTMSTASVSAMLVYPAYSISLDSPSTVIITTNTVQCSTCDRTTSGGILYSPNSKITESNGLYVLKCNMYNNEPATYPQVSASQIVTQRDCSSACTLEETCVPEYTASLTASSCTCNCKATGYGSECLPADLPNVTSDSDAASCISNEVMTTSFSAAVGSTSVCYVASKFSADVTVSLGVMENNPLNVTFDGCTYSGRGILYVMGASKSKNRLTLLVTRSTFSNGGAMVLAGEMPAASTMTIVDSKFTMDSIPEFNSGVSPYPLSALLLLYNVSLSGGSVLTVARTELTALQRDARDILVYDGLSIAGSSAVYLRNLSVETLVSPGVGLESGDVSVRGGSVLAVEDSTFLLCSNAVYFGSALSVSGASVMSVSGNTFANVLGYGVELAGSSVGFSGGSRLIVRDNDVSGTKELLASTPTVQLAGSTWSFARNSVQGSRVVSLSVTMDSASVTGPGALAAGDGSSQLLVTCNSAAGKNLTTSSDYGAAGFSDTDALGISACGTCEVAAYCDASGTASASSGGSGTCVCACSGSRSGDVCAPVGPVQLAQQQGGGSSTETEYTLESTSVRTPILIPNGLQSLTLETVEVTGAQMRVYVPWMAEAAVRVVMRDVTLIDGAVMYVIGSSGSVPDAQSLELSVCGMSGVNGAFVMTGNLPANSAITVTDSTFTVVKMMLLPYLGDSTLADYAPALSMSGLTLTSSVLIVYDVQLLSVLNGGRAVVVGGSQLTLVSSGLALDSVVFGAAYAMYVSGVSALSSGSVVRVSESKMYGGYGVWFGSDVRATDSVAAVNGNTAVLTSGPLLSMGTTATFTGSWLSVRDATCSGGQVVVALPSGTSGLVASGGTFSLYGVSGDGSTLLTGAVNVGVNVKYVAGCLKKNNAELLAYEYSTKAGVRGTTKTLTCNSCDLTVSCYAPLTKSMSGCKCRCEDGGYGPSCLPVYLPAVDGCSAVPIAPLPSYTRTLTGTLTESPTLYPTASTPTLYNWSKTETATLRTPTATIYHTPTAVVPPTGTVTITPEPTDTLTVTQSLSVEVEEGERTTACPALTVNISGTGTEGKLTQGDIRDAGNAMPITLSIALPDGYQWASVTDLGQYVSYVLMTAMQANGFAGEWGALVAAMEWTRSTEHTLTVLQTTVPRYANYLIGVDEEIRISLSPSAVYGGCQGLLLGTMRVEGSTSDSLRTGLYGVNTAMSTVSAAAALATGGFGSLLSVQVLGVFATMPCATAFEQDTAGALPYFLSFFAGLGYLWMMVGNLCITIVFAAVHFGVAAIVRRCRSVDWENAFAMVLFPSLSYLVAYLMLLGIFVPSVMMLAMSGKKAEHYAMGVIGVVYGVAFFAVVHYVLSTQSALGFTKYWQFSKKPFYTRWLFPIGYWGPEPRRMMYNSMVTGVKGRYMYWGTFPLAVLCVVGIIAAIEVPSSRCHILYFCMMAVLLVAAAVVAVTNLMRSAFLTIAQTVLFVLLAVLCLINAINYMSPSQSGQNAYSAFQIIVMVLLLFVAIYSFVIGFLEMIVWRSLREPKKTELDELLQEREAGAANGANGDERLDDNKLDDQAVLMLAEHSESDGADAHMFNGDVYQARAPRPGSDAPATWRSGNIVSARNPAVRDTNDAVNDLLDGDALWSNGRSSEAGKVHGDVDDVKFL